MIHWQPLMLRRANVKCDSNFGTRWSAVLIIEFDTPKGGTQILSISSPWASQGRKKMEAFLDECEHLYEVIVALSPKNKKVVRSFESITSSTDAWDILRALSSEINRCKGEQFEVFLIKERNIKLLIRDIPFIRRARYISERPS